MEIRLTDGDYKPNGAGGFEQVSGEEELIQRVLFRLQAKRGAFPLMPELGSRLYLLGRERPTARLTAARQYIAEALAEEELSLGSISAVDTADGRLRLTVELIDRSGSRELALEV